MLNPQRRRSRFSALERSLNVKIHSHRHDSIRIAVAGKNHVFEGRLFPLKLLTEHLFTSTLLGGLAILPEYALRFHRLLRFFLGPGGGTS